MKLIKWLRWSKIRLIFTLLLTNPVLYSQDIKGAFFQFSTPNNNYANGELFLYTDLNNNLFRPYVLLYWGNSTDTLHFVQSYASLGTVVNKYSGSHHYAGPANYLIKYTDGKRISGIKNITNSQNENLQVSSIIPLTSFMPPNSTPVIQNHPVAFAVNGNTVSYNPNFTDPDGDSLAYSLANCIASNYYMPNGVNLSSNGTLSFSKDSIGIYAFSFKVTEWKKDVDGNYFQGATSQIDFVMDINSAIGIQELSEEKQNDWLLYPNPASSKLTIESMTNVSETIEVVNSMGQQIIPPKKVTELDVSLLNAGYYFVCITMKDGSRHYMKFIKE